MSFNPISHDVFDQHKAMGGGFSVAFNSVINFIQ